MLLQREKKKELWRLASKNCVVGNQGTQSISKRYRVGSNQKEQKLWSPLEESSIDVCSPSFLLKTERSVCSTPPPPYSSLDFVERSETCSVKGITSAEPLWQTGRKCDKNLMIESNDSAEHIMNSETYPSSTSSETGNQKIGKFSKYQVLLPNMINMSQDKVLSNSIAPRSTSSLRKTTSSISINLGETVISIFRYCFTCGFLTEKNDHDVYILKTPVGKKTALTITHSTSLDTVESSFKINQDFQLLMKNLKSYQIPLLLQAVKTRKVSLPPQHVILDQQLNCILVKRSLQFHEEPFLLTCRLFFWCDLKRIQDLKRIPFCPSENNQQYECCNPLHWCRVVGTDVMRSHYDIQENHVFVTDISETNFRGGNFFDCKLLTLSESKEISNYEDMSFESFWCDVAYWELSQRVGKRHKIKSTSFNICSESIQKMSGKEDICLQPLFNSYETIANDVKTVRQKIGLGATISKEKDGVWLYNRSLVPIFLHSPTVSDESWFRVCKILPGDCVRAFDFYRDTEYTYHMQYTGIQTGPFDTKTIRFSFVKGWGCGYKRQDITRCPCWIEIYIKNKR